MTIDERLDALAQSLELLASMHRDLEEKTVKGFEEMRASSAKTDARFAETLGFINRLAHVAEAHEQRLDNLEQQ